MLSGGRDVVEAIRTESTVVATIAGLGLAALTAFSLVVATTMRPRSRQWLRRGCVVTIAVGVLGGLVASPVAARMGSRLAAWPPWDRRTTLSATDAEIAAAVAHVMTTVRQDARFRVHDDRMLDLWQEGVARIAVMQVDERETHALWRAYQSQQSYDSQQLAMWSLSWLPSDDPHTETFMMRVIVAFPEDVHFVERLHRTLWLAHPTEFTPTWTVRGTGRSNVMAVALWQVEQLRHRGDTMGNDERKLRIAVIDRLRAAWPTLQWNALEDAPQKKDLP